MDREIKTSEVNQVELAQQVYGWLQQPGNSEIRKGANVILLMGGSNLDDVTQKAFELWSEDENRFIVTTPDKGKFSGDYSEPESERYFSKLVELGIPQEKILHKPVSKNTIEELDNLPTLLEEAGIKPTRVVIVDRPIHQKRAYLNALKLQPNIKFANAPADEDFDLQEPMNQLRTVEEIERLISYKDLVRPDIPMQVLRATAKLRETLKLQGIYEREKVHPRHLYKENPRIMHPTEKPWKSEEFNK